MAQLSPKQYIQTKARSLPVYKCYVNIDWETSKMANVFVMRRHVNGNITAGVYLVDLLCLGIKDTLYFFNATEAEIKERTGEEFGKMFKEVDYNLAHNIVYAGHDFAMDFEIKPHADFAITKFILEEDNDDIPLIEIEVGEDEKPHLWVNQPGQYSGPLAKLKKIAGEGNYYYTIATMDEDDDVEEEEDDFGEGGDDFDEDGDESEADDDDSYYDMDEFDLGEITPLQAQFIYSDDLLDEERVKQRMPNEILSIQTEVALRTLKQINPFLFEHADRDENPDIKFLENENYASGVNAEQEETVANVQEGIVKFYESEGAEAGGDASAKFLLATLRQHKDNPVLVASLFENGFILQDKALIAAAKGYLEDLAEQYPIAQLVLALNAFINDEDASPYQFIYDSESLSDAFPDKNDLAQADINSYGLLQTLVKLRQDDLRGAIYYYYLSTGTEVFSWMLTVVQHALTDTILKVVNELTEEDGAGDEGEDTDDDDTSNRDKATLRIV